MAVLRTQHVLKSDAIALPDGAATTIPLPRPLTLPAEGDTIDHVVRPSVRDEFRSGVAIVTLPDAFQNASVFLRELRVVKAPNPSVPLETFDDVVNFNSDISQGALFPSGASLAGGRLIVDTDQNLFPTNGSEILETLKNLSLRENESLSLTLFNDTGGNIAADRLEVHYDFGLSPGEISLRAIK